MTHTHRIVLDQFGTPASPFDINHLNIVNIIEIENFLYKVHFLMTFHVDSVDVVFNEIFPEDSAQLFVRYVARVVV